MRPHDSSNGDDVNELMVVRSRPDGRTGGTTEVSIRALNQFEGGFKNNHNEILKGCD